LDGFVDTKNFNEKRKNKEKDNYPKRFFNFSPPRFAPFGCIRIEESNPNAHAVDPANRSKPSSHPKFTG